MRHHTLVIVPLLLAAACDARAPERIDSTIGAAPSDAAAATTSADDSAWVARPDGIGPVRVGMTAAEVRAAAGLAPVLAVGGDCTYLDATLPHGVRVMLARDTVVRAETADATVVTAAGARVGDTEQRATQLYAGRVEVQPRKYEPPPAHLLVVTPPEDSAHRIILVTDGTHVTGLRVGRLPEVAWVEGCG